MLTCTNAAHAASDNYAPARVGGLDFQFDSNVQGKAFTICNVIDEFTREHVGFRAVSQLLLLR